MHMIGRFLEDFAVGQTFRSGRVRIDTGRIKTFGAEFDPQPFHLDEEAARDTIFRGLAASGWHTAAVTMRLLVESDLKPAGGDRKSTRLNSSHLVISYAVFCLKKKKNNKTRIRL